MVGVVAVIAAFGPIVDPHSGHPELFRGEQVLRHVLDHHRARRIDREPIEQQAIAVEIRLGAKLGGMNIVQAFEFAADADRVEHAPGIRRIAIGEDELAARQPGEPAQQPRIGRDSIERDGVNVVEEMMRIDVVMHH